MGRRAVAVLVAVVVFMAVSASVALAGSEHYGAGNYSSPSSVPENYLHHLTGNQADNGSCEGNGIDCGTNLCAYAITSGGSVYGPRYCANDSVYHSFDRSYLRGVFDEYSYAGAYIYGTVFY